MRPPARFTVNQPRSGIDSDMLIVAAVAVAVVLVGVVSGLVWTAGQLSGLLSRLRWPGVPIGDAPGIASRLPDHLGDPAGAWPAEQRDAIGGPVPFYLALLLVLAALAAASILAVRLGQRIAPHLGRPSGPHAWAALRDLRELVVREPTPARITLGRHGGHLLAAEPRRSVIVVAPTQAGKTTGWVIPNVRTWHGPAVVTSVKPDVLLATIDARRERGPVHVFDPTGATGQPTVKWSPLLTCTTYGDAERTARWIVDAGSDARPASNARFWANLGGKLLAPLLYAAAGTGRHLSDVARWVDRRDVHEVEAALRQLADPDALDAWLSSRAREERVRESVYATVETVLRAFTSPSVRAATTLVPGDIRRGRALDVSRFLDRHATLYLVSPAHEQARLRPLFEALIQAVLREAHERHSRTGRPLDPALLVMLDEAGNIAPQRNLNEHLSIGAGQGIAFCTIWQDLAQITGIYGPDHAATIINNHTARLYLAGSSDVETLSTLSATIGTEQQSRATVTIGGTGQRSTSYTDHDRPAAPVQELRQLPFGHAVLLYGRLPAAKIRAPHYPKRRRRT